MSGLGEFEAKTRSGFVAVLGRPNVGKSTLVNRIVGSKVAIASDKPQTTRFAIRGIAQAPLWQLVLVDLPGVQRPRDPLTERMQRRVEQELKDCDAALFVVNAREQVGGGDRFIARAIDGAGVPAATAVNKVDRLDRAHTAEALVAAADLGVDGEVFPISARTGSGVSELVEGLVRLLPPAPFYYPPQDASDLAWEKRLSELVREQVLHRARQELPHAIDVELEDSEKREDGLLTLYARIWVETESQKAIVVGSGGQMVRAIGTAARKEIEALVGQRVHLDLTVRVRKGWRRDDALLDRLGIQ